MAACQTRKVFDEIVTIDGCIPSGFSRGYYYIPRSNSEGLGIGRSYSESWAGGM